MQESTKQLTTPPPALLVTLVMHYRTRNDLRGSEGNGVDLARSCVKHSKRRRIMLILWSLLQGGYYARSECIHTAVCMPDAILGQVVSAALRSYIWVDAPTFCFRAFLLRLWYPL